MRNCARILLGALAGLLAGLAVVAYAQSESDAVAPSAAPVAGFGARPLQRQLPTRPDPSHVECAAVVVEATAQ